MYGFDRDANEPRCWKHKTRLAGLLRLLCLLDAVRKYSIGFSVKGKGRTGGRVDAVQCTSSSFEPLPRARWHSIAWRPRNAARNVNLTGLAILQPTLIYFSRRIQSV